jgi:hypothetical protein
MMPFDIILSIATLHNREYVFAIYILPTPPARERAREMKRRNQSVSTTLRPRFHPLFHLVFLRWEKSFGCQARSTTKLSHNSSLSATYMREGKCSHENAEVEAFLNVHCHISTVWGMKAAESG